MKFRSPFNEERRIPMLGDRVVDVDEVVEVGQYGENFDAGGWEPADAEAQALHEEREAAALAAEEQEQAAEEGQPPVNASRAAWEAYALAHGKTAEDLDGLGRNDIRDLFV